MTGAFRRWRHQPVTPNRRAPLAIVFLILPLVVALGGGPPAGVIAGGVFDHTVQTGDTWRSLGSRFGVDPATLARINGASDRGRLQAGTRVRVDSRHLVPAALSTGIVINIPQRMLFVMKDGDVAAAFPVGLGRPGWPTFVGDFSVTALETDPTWDVPASIQDELRRAGKPVVTSVAPGPDNPLGKYWLGLSVPNYGIHGTNAPLSIYRFQSHGCVRLHADHIAELFSRAVVGMPGMMVYEPVVVRATEAGVWIEAHPDVYRRVSADAESALRRVAEQSGLADRIDWMLVRRLLQDRDGLPHRVDLSRESGSKVCAGHACQEQHPRGGWR